jgi:ribosomal protein L11 methyltransferase
MKYVQVQIDDTSTDQNEILIALLADIGFEGFEEESTALKAFINETAFNRQALDTLMQSQGFSYSSMVIEQQNWNAQWESSFEPVVINEFAAVRAGFHQPVKNVQHDIMITPKMSFGTGHHATTYLMMEQMSHFDLNNKTVLDFGTGTGVLAILAEKMGSSQVLAIDNDEWSINNAKENIANNACTKITIALAESVAADMKYDIILANINLNVILQNMPLIAQACQPGAKILLSGFLISDKAAIEAALKDNGLKFSSFTQKLDWISVLATS